MELFFYFLVIFDETISYVVFFGTFMKFSEWQWSNSFKSLEILTNLPRQIFFCHRKIVENIPSFSKFIWFSCRWKVNHVKTTIDRHVNFFYYSMRLLFCHWTTGKPFKNVADRKSLCIASILSLFNLLSLAGAVLSTQQCCSGTNEKKESYKLNPKKCFKITLISTLVWQSTLLIISIHVANSRSNEHTYRRFIFRLIDALNLNWHYRWNDNTFYVTKNRLICFFFFYIFLSVAYSSLQFLPFDKLNDVSLFE